MGVERQNLGVGAAGYAECGQAREWKSAVERSVAESGGWIKDYHEAEGV